MKENDLFIRMMFISFFSQRLHDLNLGFMKNYGDKT